MLHTVMDADNPPMSIYGHAEPILLAAKVNKIRMLNKSLAAFKVALEAERIWKTDPSNKEYIEYFHMAVAESIIASLASNDAGKRYWDLCEFHKVPLHLQ